ncbi:MAG: SurA N-terminal domain-containing protein [Desulfoarculaceae bacterium]|nr:SurA N-terminal domain-containing protein [Desulfoarculaceae bacterium]
MLQLLRNKAQSFVVQALVLVIALVFIFWGVGTNMMNDRDAAISVNKEEISFQEFQRSYDQSIAGYRQQFGESISEDLLKGLGIKQQVINQLIQAALLRQGTSAMGIMATPVEIQSTIQSMPQFQQNGEFNLDSYRATLGANRLTPNKFEASIGRNLLTEKGITFISNFATTISDAEIIELVRREQETVTVKVVKISPDLFNDKVTIDPQELTAWFETEQNRYLTERKIKLKYLIFPYQAQKDSIAVNDAQILAQYENDKAAYQTPEQRQARHILFKTDDNSSFEERAAQLKKAEEILARLRMGEDFATLASTYSDDPAKAQGGDLGTFSRGRMIKEFDDAVFFMQPNTISDIITTQFGYHIIKLEKIVPAVTQPLDEVRDAIAEKIRSEQARPATFQMANEAYEGIISAGSLQAYAENHPERTVISTDFFSRTAPPAALDPDPSFLDTLFALNKGELSSLVETPSGYFILYAEEIQEPVPPKLDEVREQAGKDYILAQAAKMAQETAAALLTKVKGGADLETSAGEANLQIRTTGPLSRSKMTADPALPTSLVDQALQLGASNPFPKEALAAGDDLYILQFIERHLPETADISEDTRKEYSATLLRQKQDRLLSSWLQQQEKKAKIVISKNILN